MDNGPLFINKIGIELPEPSLYQYENLTDAQFKKMLPLYHVERYYGAVQSLNFSPYTFHKGGKAYTSFDLSYNLINKISKNNDLDYDVILLVQSYPDVLSGSPLAKILNRTNLKFNTFSGLTHLYSLASIEALRVVNNLTNVKQKSLILLTELLPFEHQKNIGSKNSMNEYGDFSVGLEVCQNKGPIEILDINHVNIPHQHSQNTTSFLNFVYRHINKIENQFKVNHILLQNYFRDPPNFPLLYNRRTHSDLNLLAGDLWMSFVDLLENKTPETNEKVILIAFNDYNSFHYCVLNILDNDFRNYTILK